MKTRYWNQSRLFPCIVAVICMATSFDAVCFARLGETEAQLRARYGDASNADDPDNAWDDKTLEFSMPGPAGGEVIVFAHLVDGVSISENYLFYAKDGSEASVTGDIYEAAKAIINANSQGHTWRGLRGLPPPGMEVLWIRSDNSANTAIVWKNQPNVLEISTAESHKRVEQHKKGIGGF